MKLAVITGGSRGLGQALCERYAGDGWRVIEFSRTAPFDFSVAVDLADTDAASAVFSETFAPFAAEDISELVVINNAAVLGPIGPVERTDLKAIQAHVSANITSAMMLWRSVVESFQGLQCPKTFANISSGAANKGYAGWSLYCASKAATENFVRAVALEQAERPHPVRAYSINPGVIDTAMQREIRDSAVEDFPALDRFIRLAEEGQLVSPGEVAEGVAALIARAPEAGGTYPAIQ